MTIWQKIGTAFRNGWNNGNLAKGISAVGMSAFTVGMTGAMIHDMNRSNNHHHCRSIFGNNWMNGHSQFGGYGCNCSSMNMFNMYNNPMMLGYNNPMAMLNNMQGTNPYLTAQGQQMAYMWGAQMAQKYMQQQALQQTQLMQQPQVSLDTAAPDRGNEDAGNIDADTTAKLGKNFDEETNKLGDKDSDTKEVVISTNKEGTKADENYRKDIKALAQSYIKHIDKDNDGHISEEEFINQEIEQFKKEKPNATKSEIADAERTIKEKFALMNLNRDDNGLDWKEMSAVLASYDAGGNSDGGLDGKITREEFKNAQDSLDKLKFGNTAWNFYQKLFPDEE